MKQIKIDDIESDENVRVLAQDLQMRQLMESIQQLGLLEPVGLYKPPGSEKYKIAFGNRRLQALRMLGHVSLEIESEKPNAVILDRNTSEQDFYLINLSENLHREGNTISELGRAIKILHEKHNMSLATIAVRLSLPERRIKIAWEMYNKIPPSIQDITKFKNVGRAKSEARFLSSSTTNAALFAPEEFRLALMQQAEKNNLKSDEVRIITQLLWKGRSLEEAIEESKGYRHFTLHLYLNERIAKSLESENHNGRRWRIGKIIRESLRRGIKLPANLFLAPEELEEEQQKP